MKGNCPERKGTQKKRKDKDDTSLNATLIDDGDVFMAITTWVWIRLDFRFRVSISYVCNQGAVLIVIEHVMVVHLGWQMVLRVGLSELDSDVCACSMVLREY